MKRILPFPLLSQFPKFRHWKCQECVFNFNPRILFHNPVVDGISASHGLWQPENHERFGRSFRIWEFLQRIRVLFHQSYCYWKVTKAHYHGYPNSGFLWIHVEQTQRFEVFEVATSTEVSIHRHQNENASYAVKGQEGNQITLHCLSQETWMTQKRGRLANAIFVILILIDM